VFDYQAFRRTPQEYVDFYRLSLQPFDRFMEIFLFQNEALGNARK
jgi:NAD-dependent SIR2 family protein deacetylase